jgi:hypothetical protein
MKDRLRKRRQSMVIPAKYRKRWRDRTFIGVWKNGRTVIVAELPTEE